MDQPSVYDEDCLIRRDWWAFVWGIVCQGHAYLTFYTGLGILWILDKEGVVIPPPVIPWIAAIATVFGTFVIWRKERRANERALVQLEIPLIGGHWMREDGLDMILHLDKTTGKITSHFVSQGTGLVHDLEGTYDRTTGKFPCNTVRIWSNGSNKITFYGSLLLHDIDTMEALTLGFKGADPTIPNNFTEMKIWKRMR